jgi:AraC-like DNA-binding protein
MTNAMPNASTLRPVYRPLVRSRQAVAKLKMQRTRWLRLLPDSAPFLQMFDHIPGVYFFAKDRDGRTMFATQGILRRYGMHDETEMLGLNDYDLNPVSMADAYLQDDKLLLCRKRSRVERIELWFDPMGLPDWFHVTKLPIFDRRGRGHGVMGVLRHVGEQEMKLPLFQTVSQAVTIIRRDYARPLVIADLAEACGESLRQLQRRFQKAFGITAQEFLIRTRVLAAARLLEETHLNAKEIARQTGFVDASSFTEQFRTRTGSTPTSYRALRSLSR